VTTELVNTQFRTLHGFFGPKFQTGSGPFRVFVTGKVGFDNFSINNQNATAGFVNTVGLTNGATYFALYPAPELKRSRVRLGCGRKLATTCFSMAGPTTICG
jgi:hypothetical protein